MDGDKDQEVAPRVTGRVDTISRGIARGGDTSNARRRYARRSVYALAPMMMIDREPINFLESELVGLELPYDDPLVISSIVANFMVSRMLVDTGMVESRRSQGIKIRQGYAINCQYNRGTSLKTPPPPRQKRVREVQTTVMKVQDTSREMTLKKMSGKHVEPHEDLELVPFGEDYNRRLNG
ncbi:hypothetical protein LIER_15703 [Lithospermum erythrorhizon]|uniref:Uncharacterized protein n=1 Tax=Lithospermum erythrorhizon TaxID=34254 RepID=A0AAV3Q6B6_LITER